MKATDQTQFGDPDGNCWVACMASILELSLEDLPDPRGPTWMGDWRAWLRRWNLSLVRVDIVADGDHPCRMGEVPNVGFVPPGMTILSGVSPRGILHSTVAMNGRMLHDPHPSRAGLDAVRDWTIFTVLSPALRVHKVFAAHATRLKEVDGG